MSYVNLSESSYLNFWRWLSEHPRMPEGRSGSRDYEFRVRCVPLKFQPLFRKYVNEGIITYDDVLHVAFVEKLTYYLMVCPPDLMIE